MKPGQPRHCDEPGEPGGGAAGGCVIRANEQCFWDALERRRAASAADPRQGEAYPEVKPLLGRNLQALSGWTCSVSANLNCPVPANLNCPLFRSSGAACRTPCHKGWGQAHRLQAAGGQRYGERAEVPGGAGYALSGRDLLLNVCMSCRTLAGAAAASLKAAPAERTTGVPLSSAPRGFPWA